MALEKETRKGACVGSPKARNDAFFWSRQAFADGVPSVAVAAILVTHKHWDHQAGVTKVLREEAKNTRCAAAYVARARREGALCEPLDSTISVVAGDCERGF